jgi:hypothetical protein
MLILGSTVQPQPQNKVPKKEGATVSGKVTIKEKGAPGIAIVMRPAEYGTRGPRYKGTTDQDGNYKITNVAPGNYQVMPAAQAYVNLGESGSKTLIISEGEAIEGIDFTLIRGGVITGKAVDPQGVPLIEEQVILVPAEANNQEPRYYREPLRNIQTDDRGVYRIFGIPPGRYKVAIGQSENEGFGGARRSQYKQTFSPGVTDPAKAAVIEVTEASEATNVDITASRALESFAVSGRIVNGETQQGLPNLRIGLERTSGGHSVTSWSSASNSLGEFKLENVTPGHYSLFVPSQGAGVRAEPISIDVFDQDVSGLLLKTSKAASLSGLIVLEGRNEKAGLAVLNQVSVHIDLANDEPGNWGWTTTVNSDGSFQVSGLQSGVANISLAAVSGRPFTGLTLLRIERDGVAKPDGVEIKDGEDVTGVRLIVRYATGTIRGVIRVENGELPANARFAVWLSHRELDPPEQRGLQNHTEIDSRGRFVIEGLSAGTYEINASIATLNSRVRPPTTVQQVTVVEGAVTSVTLTVNLEPAPGGSTP